MAGETKQLQFSEGVTVTSPTAFQTLTDPTTTRGDLIRRGATEIERFAAVTDNRVVRGDGTDVVLGQIDDPAFFTTGAEVTQSAPGVVKSAGQLLGTNTNDSAASGYVGEYVIQSRVITSGLSLTSNTATNLTTSALTLTAGDWDICASVGFDPGATTVVNNTRASISKTSATLSAAATIGVPTDGEMQVFYQNGGVTPNGDLSLQIPPYRISLSASDDLYLVVQSGFTTSTMAAYGAIWARRVR